MNMKKFILSLIITVFATNVYAQSSGKNYIKETVYRTESNVGGNIGFLTPPNFENIIYFDKLGRPEQLIEKTLRRLISKTL